MMLAVALAAAVGCQRAEQAGAPQGAEASAAEDNQRRDRAQAAELLASLGGAASAEQQALYQGEFEASGALGDVAAGEGAWELQLLTDYAQFLRPGLSQDGGVPEERQIRARGMLVSAGPLTIAIRSEACTLPNGVELPYSAQVLFDGLVYRGCAKSGVSDARRASWASVIVELMPAIDACLARASSKPARVTIASQLDEASVSVRLRERDGGRAECTVAFDGSRVSEYGPVSDLDRRSGEGDPEFVRAPTAQPGEQNCRAVEPVTRLLRAANENGPELTETLGWLVRRTC
jgi:hypothetical protein